MTSRRRVPRRVLIAAAALTAGTAPAAVAQAPFWHAPAVLASGLTQAYPPRVAVEDDGGAVVAWAVGGADPAVWAATRPDGASPFGAPVRLTPVCGRSCLFYGVQAAVDPGGSGTGVVWVLSRTVPVDASTVQAVVRGAGGAFTAAEDLSAGRPFPGAAPGVAAGPGGRVVVVFDDADRRARARERTAATAWDAPAVLGDAPVSGVSTPSVAIGTGGHTAAAWQSGTCAAWVAQAPPGGPWGGATQLPGCAQNPAVTVGATGGVDAVWRGWDGVNRRVVSARAATAGAAFGAATDLGTAGDVLDPPVVRALPGDDAAAAWTGPDGTAVTARRTGAAWSAPDASSPLPLTTRSVAIGANGDVAAAGAEGPDGTPVALVRPAGGAWRAPEPAFPPGSGWNALGVAASGDVIAAASDETSVEVSERTTRPGAALVLPDPRPTRLTGPGSAAANARVPLTLTLGSGGYRVPVQVQRRISTGWRTFATATVTTPGFGPPVVTVPARLTAPGVNRVRVLVGAARRPSGTVAITVTPSGPRRVALPGTPLAIAAGPAGVWVLDQGSDVAGDTVLRRLDRRTGRPAAAVPVPGESRAIAVGADAVWTADADGVTRVDARTLAVTRTLIPGGARSVVTSGPHVWATGVCEPSAEPIFELCHPRRAEALDATNGALLGRTVRLGPAGSADAAAIFGTTLWLWGESEQSYDDSVLARADAATGAIASGPRIFPGRFGVPFTAVSARTVWIVGSQSATRADGAALPVPLPILLPRHRAVQVLPAGNRAWVLQQRPVTRTGRRDEALAEVVIATGRRTGRVLRLGEALKAGTTAARGDGAVWVLRPSEATVIRVPLPG